MTRPDIELHIDELVLRGFESMSANDRRAIAAAIEAELSRLLLASEGPSWESAAGSRPSLRADEVTLTADGDATALGTSVAATLYRALDAAARGGA